MKKTNVMRTLERKGILYTAYETKTLSDQEIDAVSVSNALGVDKSMVYKTLVVKGDLHGYIVAVIPADAQLNLKALAKVTQNKKVEMLLSKQLQEVTGYIRGGCSPIGMKTLYPTVIDVKSIALNGIIISAGRRGQQVELNSHDLAKITNGSFASITY
ncbi:Cys-tRNA(Pro) deacylase [Priestia megaterium]|uniref:Cys-tRNA(Pro)/Cys-tRNA(Cys) deacylase n=1 Tax=Priestia megaterium TaxID=1404 RepID=A0A6M6E2V0_PRIMG|nr:Cys-tRNA(Pro) deacylase [Priestia megaterium]QJX81291.1 Cys-tRNA(Pro) deacylase [Priestia megaterium]